MRIRPKPQLRRRIQTLRRSTYLSAQPLSAASEEPMLAALRRLDRSGQHPLTRADENQRLYDYEQRVKGAFARIVPSLKIIAARLPDEGFEDWAQVQARQLLGFQLPQNLLEDAWVSGLDRRALFAHATFETFRAVSDEYFRADPLGDRAQSESFMRFLLECGFHAMNVTPCSDGRQAHVIRYVLRLPIGAVQRRANAGAMFDIEEALGRWSNVELRRFREGLPNTADSPTRYLKVLVYHYSSHDPEHEGCAAHGSNTREAAKAGREQLRAFREAVENTYCCGASIEVLLLGVDTDTDRLRIHLPDAQGEPDLDRFIDAGALYGETLHLDPDGAQALIRERLAHPADGPAPPLGMQRLMARLIEGNISQLDYVRAYHGGQYPDIGHEERFIGVGMDFPEIHLRNLTYFSFLRTLEEGTCNLDVGIKIFKRLHVSHGLPIPIVIRSEYSGQVPGARERAISHCERLDSAIAQRYPDLVMDGLLYTYWTIRDSQGGSLEPVGGSLVGGRRAT
ncbi:carboxysome shell carbonic anhydrase [Caldichromatium japonicum]|uniref:Carboxysome shell carbonic anhydrase n=1 Tax=Caldichromatium japonicum TaxID=2699430 RepID=A0A6G7VG60_9GAMM|nr:carboxysome shell carbonic anhydrase [Caldichromatium japonicum]QIK38974.1 carboxysome shell carbonic anhydrase [Caldichromatium japonicum]